jgi:hypothetical protein
LILGARCMVIGVTVPGIGHAMTDNLLEPISFTLSGECGKFCVRYRCGVCLSHLYNDYEGGKYYPTCPTCGKVYKHNVIHQAQKDQVESDRKLGARELREDKRFENPLKDLGF